VKILLDENVPVQALDVLRRTLRGIEVDHFDKRPGKPWKGKKDRFLLPDAMAAGYDVIVTKDVNQLSDPEETRIIRETGIHHIRFRQGDGVAGYARAVGSLIVAMPDVVADLNAATGQRLIRIFGLDSNTKRHEMVDPATDPPPYWTSGRR